MVVIASDSFKGTLSSLEICKLFKDKFSDAVCLPIADGGEGSLEAISNILEGRFIDVEVTDLYFYSMLTASNVSESCSRKVTNTSMTFRTDMDS